MQKLVIFELRTLYKLNNFSFSVTCFFNFLMEFLMRKIFKFNIDYIFTSLHLYFSSSVDFHEWFEVEVKSYFPSKQISSCYRIILKILSFAYYSSLPISEIKYPHICVLGKLFFLIALLVSSYYLWQYFNYGCVLIIFVIY